MCILLFLTETYFFSDRKRMFSRFPKLHNWIDTQAFQTTLLLHFSCATKTQLANRSRCSYLCAAKLQPPYVPKSIPARQCPQTLSTTHTDTQTHTYGLTYTHPPSSLLQTVTLSCCSVYLPVISSISLPPPNLRHRVVQCGEG